MRLLLFFILLLLFNFGCQHKGSITCLDDNTKVINEINLCKKNKLNYLVDYNNFTGCISVICK